MGQEKRKGVYFWKMIQKKILRLEPDNPFFELAGAWREDDKIYTTFLNVYKKRYFFRLRK